MHETQVAQWRYTIAFEFDVEEMALVKYFEYIQEEVSGRLGKKIDPAMLKPYIETHNSGYTECLEFFGSV